jgi:hypothetical protein
MPGGVSRCPGHFVLCENFEGSLTPTWTVSFSAAKDTTQLQRLSHVSQRAIASARQALVV